MQLFSANLHRNLLISKYLLIYL